MDGAFVCVRMDMFHLCGNLYAPISVVRQKVLEKWIIYSSLCLYVSNNSWTIGKEGSVCVNVLSVNKTAACSPEKCFLW